MEELLNNGLINLSDLARQMYPDKKKETAANTLRAKINKTGFNRMSQAEKNAAFKIINDFHIKLMETF